MLGTPERPGSETSQARSGRERAVAAYASEIRAFQIFFGAVLIAIGAFHLLVVLPVIQIRGAIPLLAAALGAADQRVKAADETEKAAAAASDALARFRGTLAAGPQGLRSAIAALVAHGRARVGPRADPYKALVGVPRESAKPGAPPETEDVLVEEATRRQIGRHVESLGLAFEAALQPLRSLRDPPAEAEQLRLAQEAVGREIIALNPILREAFAADPNFWARWERQGAGYGVASARAADAARRIDDGLGGLTAKLTAASAVWKTRQQEQRGRAEALRAKQAALTDRLRDLTVRPAWMPVGLDGALRLYPIIVGALTLTVLFRLRYLVALRRAAGALWAGVDLELVAPSWLVGPPSSAGHWWALILIAAPLVATIHAAVAVVTDRGLFVTELGDPSQTMMLGYAAAYSALILVGLGQFVAVTRGLALPPRRRAAVE